MATVAIMETKIGEVLTCLEHIKYYSKNLTEWMQPSKRHIRHVTPTCKRLGTVSAIGRDRHYCTVELSTIISVGPLICALAAGNHAMIKFQVHHQNSVVP